MESLTNQDLHFIVSRLPKDLAEKIKNHKLIVAGGFIRETIAGGKVSDIDLFGKSVDALKLAALELSNDRKGRMFSTDNAITVLSPPRLPIQFITKWLFTEPSLCVTSFDFTVCQAGIWWDGENWQSIASTAFYPDLAARRLVYTYPARIEAAGGSMLRVRKFLHRGYSIQSGSIAGVISRMVSSMDFTGRQYDERQVAKLLTALLREVDPLTVVDGVELVDEHEVIAS